MELRNVNDEWKWPEIQGQTWGFVGADQPAARPAGGSQLEIGRSDWLGLQLGGAVFWRREAHRLGFELPLARTEQGERPETSPYKPTSIQKLRLARPPLSRPISTHQLRQDVCHQDHADVPAHPRHDAPGARKCLPLHAVYPRVHKHLWRDISNQALPCRTRNKPVCDDALGLTTTLRRMTPETRRDDVDSIPNVAHTVSQRLRRLRKIPAELIPLGSSTGQIYLANGKSLCVSRCCRWFCRLCRRLLVHAPPARRQDHPSQAPEPRCGQCCPWELRRAPLSRRHCPGRRMFTESRCGCTLWEFIETASITRNNQVAQLGIHHPFSMTDLTHIPTLPPERRALCCLLGIILDMSILPSISRVLCSMLAEGQPHPNPPDLASDLLPWRPLWPEPVQQQVDPPR